ncbi:hypothetical protein C8Q79DRAFT_1006226 [Trametes meyenii]|nr:hypothetical protein C8Q79DRAFT_1006226 [Trametes meyenii]
MFAPTKTIALFLAFFATLAVATPMPEPSPPSGKVVGPIANNCNGPECRK